MEKPLAKKKGPGRPKKKNSTISLNGMGLTPEEDKIVTEGVSKLDISVKQLQRALVRQWIEDGCHGVLNYKSTLMSIKSLSK